MLARGEGGACSTVSFREGGIRPCIRRARNCVRLAAHESPARRKALQAQVSESRRSAIDLVRPDVAPPPAPNSDVLHSTLLPPRAPRPPRRRNRRLPQTPLELVPPSADCATAEHADDISSANRLAGAMSAPSTLNFDRPHMCAAARAPCLGASRTIPPINSQMRPIAGKKGSSVSVAPGRRTTRLIAVPHRYRLGTCEIDESF